MEDKEFKLERGRFIRLDYHNFQNTDDDMIRWTSPNGKDVDVRVVNLGIVFSNQNGYFLDGAQVAVYQPSDVPAYRLSRERGFCVEDGDLEEAFLDIERQELFSAVRDMDLASQMKARIGIAKFVQEAPRVGQIYSLDPECRQDPSNYEILHFVTDGVITANGRSPLLKYQTGPNGCAGKLLEDWNRLKSLKDLRPEPEEAKRILTAMLE